MYKVVKAFDDLQDAKVIKGGIVYHHYDVGDIYPRKGYDPLIERVAELESKDNLQRQPLIEMVGNRPKKSKKAEKEEEVE